MAFPILMYHEISRDVPSDLKRLSFHPSYVVSLADFIGHLENIKRKGIETVDLDQVVEEKKKEIFQKIVLSFDDGLLGNYVHAFPALKSTGLKATIFCAVSLIGKKNMMTWEHLREMSEANISIQSHGYSHRPLASLSRDEIDKELKQSKEILEDKLGKPVSFISLPHGSFNQYVITAAHEAGYQKVCTSMIGCNDNGRNYCLNRVLLKSNYSLQEYKEIISCKYDFGRTILSQRIKQFIKDTIGHRNYLNIYHKIYKLKRTDSDWE